MKPRELRVTRAVGPTRRTYLPLEELRRKPSDYDVTTTGLLYYPERGFEVHTPVWQHYVQYQRNGSLRPSRWESFEDPAQLTYSAYVAERRDQEAFLDRLFERPSSPVSRALQPLLGLLSALRFPLHGLQMTAAYVGALAPSGRITVVAALQSADELRRIQRLCQWLSRSGVPLPQLDALGRELWQQAPAFQPLRRIVEELLVTYDWGEALIALNGIIKPLFDRMWFEQLAGIAERQQDEILEKTLSSLADDGRWHEAWFVAFSRVALAGDPANAAVFQRVAERLLPSTSQAMQALLPTFGELLGDDGGRAYAWRELEVAQAAHWRTVSTREVAGEDERGRHE